MSASSTPSRPLDDVVQSVIDDKHRLEAKLASSPSLLESSFKSAAQLVGLQLGTRLLTFALNQALLRLSTPAAFGTVSIQLDLLLHSALFLAREPVRDAFVRLPPSELESKPQVRNVAWLPVFLGIPLAWVLAACYLSTSSLAVQLQSGFYATVLAYVCSASLELLSEPCFLHARAKLDTQKRVRIEGLAFTIKSLLNVALLLFLPDEELLWAFAAGQLSYGLVIFSSYWWTSSAVDLQPRKVPVTK